jgi:hypothetical protein
MISLLDALADPNLFKPHFKGDSWAGWKAMLGALFALPMDPMTPLPFIGPVRAALWLLISHSPRRRLLSAGEAEKAEFLR